MLEDEDRQTDRQTDRQIPDVDGGCGDLNRLVLCSLSVGFYQLSAFKFSVSGRSLYVSVIRCGRVPR